MDLGAATHPGYVRSGNEDGFLASREHAVFAVADGMGGHEHGEVASHLALEAIIHYAESLAHAAPTELPALLHQAIQEANTAILSQALEQDAQNRMGTTIVLATICDNRLYFAHIGDSRLYLLRGELFTQLTRDHSLVQAMVDRGEITPDEAAIHPLRHQITRVVGGDDTVSPEIASQALEPDDIVLLCTDGLSGVVPLEQIKRTLLSDRGAQEKADALVQDALAAGGPDNVTALVITFLTPRPLPAAPERPATAPRRFPAWQSTLLVVGVLAAIILAMAGWGYAHPYYYLAANTRGELGLYRHWPMMPMLPDEHIRVNAGFTLSVTDIRPFLQKYGDIERGIPVDGGRDAGISLLKDFAKQAVAYQLNQADTAIEHGDLDAARIMLRRARALDADPIIVEQLETKIRLGEKKKPNTTPR